MANGETVEITLTVTVGAGVDGTILNTAMITGNEDDPIPENNKPEEPTLVVPQVDLTIDKSDNPDPVVAGEDLTYTLTVTNNGPSDATGVSVTDTLPPQVTYRSATASQGTALANGQQVFRQSRDLGQWRFGKDRGRGRRHYFGTWHIDQRG